MHRGKKALLYLNFLQIKVNSKMEFYFIFDIWSDQSNYIKYSLDKYASLSIFIGGYQFEAKSLGQYLDDAGAIGRIPRLL